jgi:hypothetical protein
MAIQDNYPVTLILPLGLTGRPGPAMLFCFVLLLYKRKLGTVTTPGTPCSGPLKVVLIRACRDQEACILNGYIRYAMASLSQSFLGQP